MTGQADLLLWRSLIMNRDARLGRHGVERRGDGRCVHLDAQSALPGNCNLDRLRRVLRHNRPLLTRQSRSRERRQGQEAPSYNQKPLIQDAWHDKKTLGRYVNKQLSCPSSGIPKNAGFTHAPGRPTRQTVANNADRCGISHNLARTDHATDTFNPGSAANRRDSGPAIAGPGRVWRSL